MFTLQTQQVLTKARIVYHRKKWWSRGVAMGFRIQALTNHITVFYYTIL